MASVQSHFLEFWIRRLSIFRVDNLDPQAVRNRSERAVGLLKPHKEVQISEVNADSVPSEWVIPSASPDDRVLLYIHGGAWVMGSTKTHRALVSHLAYESGVRALSINYRLAPEHPFPEGLEDCIKAYEWLVKDGISPHKIVVAGDSAGGNLTLALLVALRDEGKPLPAGAVALSPATDLAFTGKSVITHKQLDPFFSDVGPNTLVHDYIKDHDPQHPLISPLYADLSGLPPILLHVGEHEILLDDAVRFGDKATAAGVDAQTVVWAEMFHVFQLFTPLLPEARQAIVQIAAFIKSRMEDETIHMKIT
jgi:monoterpene epsilon-lactone hydrolase